jgi:hypothetical protein
MSNSKFLNIDEKSEIKMVDLLDEDKALSGQKFVCMSFISPETIIKNKELFYFKEFLNKWDFQTSMNKFNDFINFMSTKYPQINIEELQENYKQFIKSEYDILMKGDITDNYKTFVETYQTELNSKFEKNNNFQTSVRGLKVRGVFETMNEAEIRCKSIRNFDPDHDVFVGPVGQWIPWDPEAYKTGRVEYMEEELNKLMHEKDRNDKMVNENFNNRVKDTKKTAIENNIKQAKITGNVLTQTINEDGDLVGTTTNMSTLERDIKTNIDGDNDVVKGVHKQLFDDENIRSD